MISKEGICVKAASPGRIWIMKSMDDINKKDELNETAQEADKVLSETVEEDDELAEDDLSQVAGGGRAAALRLPR